MYHLCKHRLHCLPSTSTAGLFIRSAKSAAALVTETDEGRPQRRKPVSKRSGSATKFPSWLGVEHNARKAESSNVPVDQLQLLDVSKKASVATLSLHDWQAVHQPNGLSELLSIYSKLSKDRLSVMVTITALAGYLVASPFAVSTSVTTACACGLGTLAMSSSANTFNQLFEVPYDAQMKRTQQRVLVRARISHLHAALFGLSSAGVGTALLYSVCNPLTAGLGLANILLYSGVYTPMKRVSIGCTWAGAVVGAIPPLMGWAACTGELPAPAWVLAGMLYAWQFPHFNSLSWNLRADYSKAGYRVMCVTNPGICTRTTLRYSYVLLGLCSVAAPMSDLTSWAFAVDSIPLNAIFIYLAHKFAAQPDAQSSRRLFRFSLVYLPALMLLLVVSAFGRVLPSHQIDSANHHPTSHNPTNHDTPLNGTNELSMTEKQIKHIERA